MQDVEVDQTENQNVAAEGQCLLVSIQYALQKNEYWDKSQTYSYDPADKFSLLLSLFRRILI